MAIQTIFGFDSAANFNLSGTQIASGKAKLVVIPNPGQVFTQDFSSSSGFTFDPALAEFVAGVLQQKDQRPANATFYADFSSLNANWSTGVGTGTAVNGAVVSGGELVLSGAAQRYVDYAALGNANFQQAGTVRVKVRPGYSGSPSQTQYIFCITESGASFRNMIVLEHTTAGALNLRVYDQSLVNVIASAFGTWVPVSNTQYEIELNIDLTTGATRLFVDGIQLGSTATTTAIRSSAIGLFRIGQYFAVQNVTNLLKFDSIAIFSTIQHTANYAPNAIIPATIYGGSAVVLPAFSYTGLGTIQAVESSVVTETLTPRYIVAGAYFNGVAWVVSDGTYSQANDSATVIANLPSLTVVGAGSFTVKVVFTDSNSQSSVDLISVTVTGQKYQATGYIESAQALQVQELISYVQSDTLPGLTTAKIILQIDGALKYHNGVAWVTSNGTSAQANLASELDAAFSDLVLSENSSVVIRWVLSTSTNVDTPELDSATIEYDFGGVETTPTKCLIYGYLKDILGNPIANATATFKLSRANATEYKEASANIIFKPTATTTTNDLGYFEIELIRSSEFEGSAVYSVAFTRSSDKLNTNKGGTGAPLTFEVPDAEAKDITDLLAAS